MKGVCRKIGRLFGGSSNTSIPQEGSLQEYLAQLHDEKETHIRNKVDSDMISMEFNNVQNLPKYEAMEALYEVSGEDT